MNNSDRTAKIEKIRALRAKTVANGCTEGEAEAATRLANTLMTKYSIVPSEVDETPSVSIYDLFRETMRDERVRQAREYAARAASGQTCTCDPFIRSWFVGNDVTTKGAHHTASCPLYTAPAPRRTRTTTEGDPKPSTRTRTSHKNCLHENTKAARARCRNQRNGW